MKRKSTRAFLRYLAFNLGVILLGSVLGYHQLTPSKAPSSYDDNIISLTDVTSDQADYAMVMSHVYHLSGKPHPSGSTAIKEVQNYLTEQLEAIPCSYQTLNFEVDMAPVIDKKSADYEAYMKEHPEERASFDQYLKGLGFSSYEEKLRSDYNCTTNTILPMTNYLVKLDVPESNEGVLFVSHYDSTSGGPGAGDDLISVAAMLEALRAATKNTDRKNDLYFLFTDGEEIDLFGAENYVNTYSAVKDQIKLVINLEARGNSGPLIIFETSLRNKNIIRTLNKALDHNLMFSFATAVYRLMPNDTDLTSFLQKDYPGINFAMIGSPENYHARTDTYANLNRDSAYMYYMTTSALADYFSSSDLESLSSSEDAVFFPFLKGNTIVVSNQWMLIISYVLGAFCVLWIGFLFKKKVLVFKSFIMTLALLLISFVPAVILGILCSFLYNKLLIGREFLQTAASLNLLFYTFHILSILITAVLVWWLTKKRKTQAMLAGILLLFTLTNIACTVLLNGLAYIFTIPLGLFFIFSLLHYFNANKEVFPRLMYLYVALCGIILCLLYIPVMDLLYTALLNDAILAVLLIASLGVLPFAVLSISTINLRRENEVLK